MSTRSGTENRKRHHQVNVRLNDEEYAAVRARADHWGITIADAIRWPAVDFEQAVDQARPHVLSSDCWCNPTVEVVP